MTVTRYLLCPGLLPATAGAWVAYYSDGSGSPSVFAEELDALRHAYDRSMTVTFVLWGESVSDAEKRARERKEAL